MGPGAITKNASMRAMPSIGICSEHVQVWRMALSVLSNLLVLQSCIRLLLQNKSAPGRSCVSNAVAINHVGHSVIWLVRLDIIYLTFGTLGWTKRSVYKSYHLSRLVPSPPMDRSRLIMYTRFYSIRVGVYNQKCLCLYAAIGSQCVYIHDGDSMS